MPAAALPRAATRHRLNTRAPRAGRACTVDAMQPSPDEWFDSLDEADRAAFIQAAETGQLTDELYRKLAAVNVPATRVAFERSDRANLSPRHYLQYVRQRTLDNG